MFKKVYLLIIFFDFRDLQSDPVPSDTLMVWILSRAYHQKEVEYIGGYLHANMHVYEQNN